ncbi:hypothetical protein H310_03998 [Aphanomyces invadans]|uniref:FAD dependent oxidoreductase domain-containing protein n=1 Tax=Aphanomyces invadans TaxID=157072 RepID=A0A024UFD8_9STRA|nr:hypothetical protein H310_03998 [Aphanomyces invadans]ETW04890.1 hypothetical protein H310_03998 [Aphanomyces invadans]RHY32602.1 hypothetical protein DYB32_002598 [Aphanomyces invadans]|eukprot:XP_008866328.1 hypothetical protein H310_03998 [Aphanomyces invadans]
MQKEDFDVIVLGLGGMGSSACFNLAQRGLSTLGIEQFGMAHALGSSHGKSRLIRKAYAEHPSYVPLLQRSYELWDELAALSGEDLFHRTGLLYVGHATDSEMLRGVEASAAIHGLPIDHLTASDCLAKHPSFIVPEGYRAIFEADAGYIVVERAVAAFCTQAERHGAELHFNEQVLSWNSTGDGVTVTTNYGAYRAKKLVVAAGPWASSVLSDAALPLTVHRVPLFWYDVPARSVPSLNGMPCFGFDMPYGFIYGFPHTPDDGLKIAAHVVNEATAVASNDPANVDRTTFPASEEALVRKCIQSCLPCVPSPVPPRSTVTCMYTMSPDGHFILDYHPSHANIVIAAGFSGHGYKFCPVVGEIIADLVQAKSSSYDFAFLRLHPTRWKDPHPASMSPRSRRAN